MYNYIVIIVSLFLSDCSYDKLQIIFIVLYFRIHIASSISYVIGYYRVVYNSTLCVWILNSIDSIRSIFLWYFTCAKKMAQRCKDLFTILFDNCVLVCFSIWCCRLICVYTLQPIKNILMYFQWTLNATSDMA